MAHAGRCDVLYDGGCGLCERTAGWLRWADVRKRLTFSDINSEWDRLIQRYPSLDRDACLAAMHVMAPDGTITAGFDGFRTLARVVPALWPVWPLLFVPGVPPIGRRVYGYVAQNRSTECTIEVTSRKSQVTSRSQKCEASSEPLSPGPRA